MSSDASDLPTRLAASLEEEPELLPPESHVLVALSGGGDSMALLHLLLELRGDLSLRLTAAHFDHAVRPESASEARRVEAWAREAGVSCVVGRAEEELARTQEAFRRARYAFLEATAARVSADRVATGHQADDQAETVLFRILRGTGLRGLRGIPRRRGRIVRPLLPFWRRDVEAFLEERGIAYLRDPSNREREWDRVRIRDEVIPALEEAWGEPVRERLVQLAEEAAGAVDYLEERAGELLDRATVGEEGPPEAWATGGHEARSLDLPTLRDANSELVGMAIRRAVRELGVRLSRGGTRAAMEFISEGRSGGRIDLGDGLVMAREFDRLRLGRPDEPGPDEPLTIESPEAGRSELVVGGRHLEAGWRPASWEERPAARDRAVSDEEGRYRAAFPLEGLTFPLLLRGWRDGDRIRLSSGTRKLKKLFNDRRVPRSQRSRTPLLASDGGRVLWGPGLGRDAALAPRRDQPLWLLTVEDV